MITKTLKDLAKDKNERRMRALSLDFDTPEKSDDRPKTTKEERPKVVKEERKAPEAEHRPKADLWSSEPTEYDTKKALGNKFFTRHGRVTVLEVGYTTNVNSGRMTPVLARVEVSPNEVKDVLYSSLRPKAVAKGSRGKYSVFEDAKTASGKPCIGKDDEITDTLKGLVKQELMGVFVENGYNPDKYKALNPGMTRMTLGNLLRGKATRGERVVIFGKTIVDSQS